MNEGKSIAEFIHALDLMIRDNGSNLNVVNAENKELLALADKISKIDYSGESKIYRTLAKKLLKIKKENCNGELSDAELENAAGGLGDINEKKDYQS